VIRSRCSANLFVGKANHAVYRKKEPRLFGRYFAPWVAWLFGHCLAGEHCSVIWGFTGDIRCNNRLHPCALSIKRTGAPNTAIPPGKLQTSVIIIVFKCFGDTTSVQRTMCNWAIYKDDALQRRRRGRRGAPLRGGIASDGQRSVAGTVSRRRSMSAVVPTRTLRRNLGRGRNAETERGGAALCGSPPPSRGRGEGVSLKTDGVIKKGPTPPLRTRANDPPAQWPTECPAPLVAS